MAQIFFTIPNPSALSAIAEMAHDYHWWDDGSGVVFGVANNKGHVNPLELTDVLTAIGATVLPSVRDKDMSVPQAVVDKLQSHGVSASDNAFGAASKMAAASGMPVLRPHKY